MTISHCKPSGSLGAGELGVPAVSASNSTVFTPTGSKRGVLVSLHGMTGSHLTPPPVVEDSGAPLPYKGLTFANHLKDDGWVSLWVPCVEDGYSAGVGPAGIMNDVLLDAGHGSRYLDANLRHWDHVVNYIKRTYGDWPIIVYGGSWGGWRVLQILANRESTVVAGMAHIYAPKLSSIDLGGFDFTSMDCSGADCPDSIIDDVTVPVFLSWHTDDIIVPQADPQAVHDSAVAAGVPVTKSSQTTGNHAMLTADETQHMAFITSVMDPLCPASF